MHDGKDGKFSSLSGLQFETFHKIRNKQIFDEQYDGGDDDYKVAPGSEQTMANERTIFDGKQTEEE